MTTNFADWRVLAVDDEPDNLKLIGDVLEFKGAVVGRADGGQAALDMVDTFKPTLVLLDLAMPGLDGWDLHKHLRSRKDLDHVPIIALTALAMPQDAQRVVEAGFDGYITKPFRFAELMDQIVRFIDAFERRNGNSPGGGSSHV